MSNYYPDRWPPPGRPNAFLMLVCGIVLWSIILTLAIWLCR